MRRVALILALLCPPAAAQQMYKCKDAQGKISYSNDKCGPGTTDLGEVKDKINLAPPGPVAPRPAADPAGKPPAPAPSAQPKAEGSGGPAAERRCFVVGKNEKGGNIVRCNDKPGDKPEEPDPK